MEGLGTHERQEDTLEWRIAWSICRDRYPVWRIFRQGVGSESHGWSPWLLLLSFRPRPSWDLYGRVERLERGPKVGEERMGIKAQWQKERVTQIDVLIPVRLVISHS